jgi:dTDP-4-dehydrorhamnose 3,5-epimerase
MSLKNNNDIEGIIIKKLVTHKDERGFFREIIRSTDDFFQAGFGQLSHSIVYHGIIKAWHLHKYQSQWTYVASGTIKVALYDTRKNSDTHGQILEFIAGENLDSFVYLFPPGVAHGYKCINGPASVIYITSGQYDLDDELRIRYDDPEIGFDWLTESFK